MTLTQTAIITKNIITISVLATVLSILSFIGYKLWYAYYLSAIPPVEEKPDYKFGSLPPIDFPEATVSSSNFSYSIDTTTGNLPKVGIDPGFEKIIKVYFVIKPVATLLSSEKSLDLAEKFAIFAPLEILSETSYQFQENDKNLRVDIDSGNFIYTKESSPSARENLDDEDKLAQDFQNMLSFLGISKDELKNGRSKVIILNDEEGLAQISLWPKFFDKREVFTPQFNKSLVNAVVRRSADNLENYLALNFTFWNVDTTTFATYPTKSAEAAFEDLKSGKGVITIEPSKPQVSITSISLGYYLADNYTLYLQPIYIFEGPQFASYVSAVNQ